MKTPCSATCGQGFEIWIRYCDNSSGKYGGEMKFCISGVLFVFIFSHDYDYVLRDDHL